MDFSTAAVARTTPEVLNLPDEVIREADVTNPPFTWEKFCEEESALIATEAKWAVGKAAPLRSERTPRGQAGEEMAAKETNDAMEDQKEREGERWILE